MTPAPNALKSVFKYIDDNKSKFIDNLKAAVAIPSVSSVPEHRPDVIKMINWAADRLTALNANVEICDNGFQTLPDNTKIQLPPIILGSLGTDSSKPTICIYGHLDVQPAAVSDGWHTDPFVLTLKDDKLYGRGSTDDKGPAISWLHVVEAYQKTNNELPVNLKFCFEGMEESGSDGLDELIISRKDTFFKDVDYVCISDTYWLGTTKPCIGFGLRGMVSFTLEISCASKDLHSGSYGGSINEAMTDLIAMLDTLLDKDGKILIPGMYDDVEALTDEEKQLYAKADFDKEAYRLEIGTNQLIHDKKEDVLMSRWRYPSLTIHGIEGAFGEPGWKSIIPGKVVGKFSVRIVPNQTADKVGDLVVNYIKNKWKLRGSANNMKIIAVDGACPWKSDPNHEHYNAAKRATVLVYGVDPDYNREGGSIPVTLTFENVLGKNVLLLPMGRSDDGAHSQNEKLDVSNYIQGTKLMAAYFYEAGGLPKTSS